ncbi:hypothetical protein LWI28_010393 [Acer negundo]|uniref:Uncharacterized protein n=1 Tax=Acer negundo TaxID=4023 RepID=A0AAD5JFH6_ACENE|nr:hypothetical protein LWI28_010393 [Acer negundo]
MDGGRFRITLILRLPHKILALRSFIQTPDSIFISISNLSHFLSIISNKEFFSDSFRLYTYGIIFVVELILNSTAVSSVFGVA